MSRTRSRHPSRIYESQEDYCANEHAHEILCKGNVTIAFGGVKTVNGLPTGEPCVVVGVERKVKKDLVPKEHLIPSLIGGIKTDVIEFPRVYSSSTCTGESGLGCPPHDQKYRPIIGGVSAVMQGGTACTVGLIVRDTTDRRLVAITNNHCGGLLYDPDYAIPDYGLPDVSEVNMMQPSPNDSGVDPDDIYGIVKRAIPIKFGLDPGSENLVDCSISTVDEDGAWYGILDVENTIHGITGNGPYPFTDKNGYNIGDTVYKSGRTTGLTPPPATLVTSKDVAANVFYYGTDTPNNKAAFTNLVMYDAASRFTNGGDSGSAILVFKNGRYRVAGLHFAATPDGFTGMACPIETVASLLNIEPWDGVVTVPGDPRQTITVNGVQYRLVSYGHDPITHNPDV